MGLRRMPGKMALIAILLCIKMVDLKPKPKMYLIEVEDSNKMEHGFDYHEKEFEYFQHMHQTNPQGNDKGNVGKVEESAGYENKVNEGEIDDPTGYESKTNEDGGHAGKAEEPNGYGNKVNEDETDDPTGYENKANKDEGGAVKAEEPNGYESKANEDEADDPKGYENKGSGDKLEEKSSPANSAGKIRRHRRRKT